MTDLRPCPHCFTRYNGAANPDGREDGRRWLDPNVAMNPLSRRTSEYICCDCGKAEGMADMIFPGHRKLGEQQEFDRMLRVAVYNDRCEGRRLPPGMPWGPSMTPTNGSVVGAKDPLEHRCECGSLWFWGFACSECKEISPALEALAGYEPFEAMHEADRKEAQANLAWQVQKDREHAAEQFIGYPGRGKCLMCQNDKQPMKRDDYLCIRCRSKTELADTPLLAHVLAKLDQMFGPSQ